MESMRLNSETRIVGKKVVLVPYRKCHVPKYHEWMESEELRHLTASERLSLDEEYEMQQTWLNDDDKCTFIVLDRETYDSSQDDVRSMVGDVNLFLNDTDDRQKAEIEVMIAEEKYRGRGLGRESVLAMIFYGIERLQMERFSAKIGYNNRTSLLLFQSLSFTEVSRSDVLEEVTLELVVTEQYKNLLHKEMEHLVTSNDCLN